MAKTIAEKLFIKSGNSVAVIHAPQTYLSDTLADRPDNVTITSSLGQQHDQIHYFSTSQETLLAEIASLKAGLKPGGVLWICYPKGGDKAKIETDLNRDKIWEMLKPYGVTPNRQIAIDETWSALRFKIAN